MVILAAGMGRRFGGLKQLTPVGPGGEAIMDYTVYDALRAGFDEIVLVIRREIAAEVRAHVEAGFGRLVSVKYVCQELGDAPASRSKPWGTGQAVLAAAPVLRGPFAVANADDFYGADALAELGAFLSGPAQAPPTWLVVGYRVLDTLPATGTVSRGLLRIDDGWLQAIDEVHTVRRLEHGAGRDEAGETRKLAADTLVSMNLWGFGPEVLDHLQGGFDRFRAGSPGDEDEYYLPVGVAEAIADGGARVKVSSTRSRWCGMTSADDLIEVKRRLAEMTHAGVYPWPLR